MKTDNEELFDFSLEEFQKCGFELKNVTRDLYSGDISQNIATEYETKFVEEGRKIYRLEAYLPENQ